MMMMMPLVGSEEVVKKTGPASLGLTDYSQVQMLGLRYKCGNFAAGKSPG